MTEQHSKKKKKFIETNFLTGIESILASRLSIAAWFTPLSFMILVIVLGIWAWISEVDVISPATGELVPSQEIQLIQPKEIGVVKAILVSSGDKVAKGQLIVQLNDSDLTNQLSELQEEIEQLATEASVLKQQKDCFEQQQQCLTMDKVNLLSLLKQNYYWKNSPLSTETQITVIQLFSKRWRSFIAQKQLRERQVLVLQSELQQKIKEISYTKEILPMYKKRFQRMLAMQEENLTAGSKVEESLEREMEQKQRLINAVQEKESLLAKIAVSESELETFIQDTTVQVNDEWFRKHTEYKVKQKNKKRVEHLLLEKKILSPIAGTVFDRTIVTIGGVVQSGEILMKIIPQGTVLQAKIKILNKDRGFISKGDTVIVKVDAYPFTKHGAIDGKIDKIASAAILDEQLGPVYPAIINLLQLNITVNKKPATIIPGMTVTADIYQGKRLLAEYVLTPLLRYKDEALRER